ANPYLVAAALLAGGLHGLQERLTLPAADAEPAPLPGDLSAALTNFENALWLNDMLGKNFCTSYAATRRAELERYETWLKTTITEWETARHLEHQ
ncbi:glutamine synthetase, partial [Mycobacterium manitobense]|nr:glutamine synthetase [[Mycobacterium] manitobense]